MAAKKTATKKTTTTKKTTATPAKAASTKAAAARPAVARKQAAPKPAKTTAAKTTASKTTTNESSAKTKPATKAPAKKPLKLTDAQERILQQIESAGESGFTPTQKPILRSIDKLRELKLVKRGAKDKATGNTPFMTTAAGKKHLASKATS